MQLEYVLLNTDDPPGRQYFVYKHTKNVYSASRHITYIIYNRTLHNIYGPAAQRYTSDDKLSWVEYHVNNKTHRLHDPAVIEYNTDSIKYICYCRNGVPHNKYGPAIIEFYYGDKIASVKYYVDGQLHNNSGPAVIEYNYNGTVEHTEYWKTGEILETR